MKNNAAKNDEKPAKREPRDIMRDVIANAKTCALHTNDPHLQAFFGAVAELGEAAVRELALDQEDTETTSPPVVAS